MWVAFAFAERYRKKGRGCGGARDGGVAGSTGSVRAVVVKCDHQGLRGPCEVMRSFRC